jgi:hypothetical protein
MRKRTFDPQRITRLERKAGICCFVLGLVVPILGGLLTVIEWIASPTAHYWIHIVATALFISGIPLILFAGFFLDWAESEQKEHDPRVGRSNRRA